MHQTSKPRRAHKDEHPGGVYWFEDQERLDRLYAYCCQDVEVERELYGRLAPLSPAEQSLWALSTTINGRGFHIDRAFAEAARQIAQAAAPEIDARAGQPHRRHRYRHQPDRTAASLADRAGLRSQDTRPEGDRAAARARAPALSAPCVGAPARWCPSGGEEDQRAAQPCRRRRSHPRRLSLSRSRYRPMERRRVSGAEFKAPDRRRS